MSASAVMENTGHIFGDGEIVECSPVAIKEPFHCSRVFIRTPSRCPLLQIAIGEE